ncbi:MAG: PHP domain-containing protein [Lachnospiraceae bacterium]|nr:PHP domain-containing protein [Lachnospiraceae bacterium]
MDKIRNLVDLHTHSTASDGTLTPAQVVRHAYDKGLKAIALTDHDTVDGVAEAMQECAALNEELAGCGVNELKEQWNPFEVIPGIEISCNYGKTELHILGLFIDYKNEELCNALVEIREKRIARNKKMVELFQEHNMDITLEDLYHGNYNTVITRAHFARIMLEKGYIKTKAEAFDRYIGPGCPLYLPKPTITPEHAMSMLTGAKAVPVLAHPYQYKLGDAGTEECVQYLMKLGLKGVEAYHSSNNTYESGKLKDMAVRNGLLVTGGSDFHGANKPDIEIGCGRGGLRVHESLLEDVRKCKKLFS